MYKGLEINRKSGRKSTVPFNPFCLHLTAKDCRKIIGEKYCDRLQLWRILVWQSSQSDSPCITTFQNGDVRAEGKSVRPPGRVPDDIHVANT